MKFFRATLVWCRGIGTAQSESKRRAPSAVSCQPFAVAGTTHEFSLKLTCSSERHSKEGALREGNELSILRCAFRSAISHTGPESARKYLIVHSREVQSSLLQKDIYSCTPLRVMRLFYYCVSYMTGLYFDE